MQPAPPEKRPRRSGFFGAWYPGQRKTIYLAAAVLGFSVFVLVVYIQKAVHLYRAQTPGHPPDYGDFLALWSYARLLFEYPPAELYDWDLLHARQVALGTDPDSFYPFPYPPFFMLMVTPLGLLPYEASHLAWIGGTLALFVWAVRATCSRLPLCLAAAAIAPPSVAAIIGGQSGFLAAALITAGMRLAPVRPVLGGILLGLLAYKPQLGVLVPVGLAAAGSWRATGAAAATVAALSVAATLAFGPAIWPAWLDSLPGYNDRFNQAADVLRFRPTLLAGLQLIGVPDRAALAAQLAAAAVVTGLVWRCFRSGNARLSAASLFVGTFLATPHAVIYDLPMVTAALALFIQSGIDDGRGFSGREVPAMLLVALFPAYLMLPTPLLPIGWLCIVPCFAAIVRRAACRTAERHELS